MGEYFDADAIVATIFGWYFSIPTGILNMETQLQTLPGVLYLYTPMQKFCDPRSVINIFCDTVFSQQFGSDEMSITSSVAEINSNISAEEISSSILSSNLNICLSAKDWSIMLFRFLV